MPHLNELKDFEGKGGAIMMNFFQPKAPEFSKIFLVTFGAFYAIMLVGHHIERL